MTGLSCINATLHHLSLDAASIHSPPGADTASDFQEYVDQLVDDSVQAGKSRLFQFPSSNTEVRGQIQTFLTTDATWQEATEAIAQRLLRIELDTQERYSQLGSLRRGSLLQLRLTDTQNDYFLITKVDHSKNLDQTDLAIHFGLPFEHRTQKTCLIDLASPDEATVTDTNSRLATYWWSDFLELEELRSSSRNTKTAFTAFEHLLRKEVHPRSHGDYQILRNNLVGYFKTQPDLSYDDLIQNVIGSYTPENDSINIDDLKKKALDLPQKKHFDTSFEIDYNTVKNKTKNRVVLADNLELNLRGPVDNLDQIVVPEKDPEGRKSLRIYSDSGYDEFQKSTQ